MTSMSDSEDTLNVVVTASGISAVLNSSKGDSLVALKKDVITENSLLASGDKYLNGIEKSGTQSANSFSQDIIMNEVSDVPQNSNITKRRSYDIPNSCCIDVDDEGK
jgi:hypothetical protein